MNIYSKCFASTLSLLDTRLLHAAQRKAIDLVKNLLNGIGLISKPTAIAKIALLARMVKPFLCVLLTLDCDSGAGILVCTLNNSAEDEIAEQMHGSTQDNFLTKDAIIICMYSIGTEGEVINIRAEVNEDQVSDNLSLIANQPILSVAPLVLATYASS